MTPADRIRGLVGAGKVSREEGERLLAALGPERGTRPAWSIALNPFDRFGGGAAAIAGLVVSLGSLALARLGAHFDGFLDMHFAHGHAATIGTSLIEQLVSWVGPALLFWAYARAITPHVRAIDFIGFVGLARAPLLVMGIVTAVVDPELPVAGPPRLTPALLAVTLAVLPLLGWFLALLYLGFKNATGFPAVSGKLIGGFVGLLVVSEAASKAVLAMSH